MTRLLPNNYIKFDNKIISSIHSKIDKHIYRTPLQFNERLSNKFNANIYLKREDLRKQGLLKLEVL